MKPTDFPSFSIEKFILRHRDTGKEYEFDDLTEAKFKRDLYNEDGDHAVDYNPWELFAKIK